MKQQLEPKKFRLPRRSARQEAWAEKHLFDEMALIEADRQVSERAYVRRHASLANGLTKYRRLLGLTRVELAEALGISRKSLYNYENSISAVPGDLLEKIVKRGDVSLHELFDIPHDPEPDPNVAKLKLIDLTMKLVGACHEISSSVSLSRIGRKVRYAAADWPKGIQQSEKNIQKTAKRLMDELEVELLQEEWEIHERSMFEDEQRHIKLPQSAHVENPDI